MKLLTRKEGKAKHGTPLSGSGTGGQSGSVLFPEMGFLGKEKNVKGVTPRGVL